ncbi:unnamed protein product [Hymenolepis diminuta]|uniref:Secreted protein n=1 Tax=Hymenolepis diminuta TaxID=6216 RepID=A0A0R3SKJ1_HYMDI|nr:unnamed protein product [Hymenolepis diminuta]
MLVLTTLIISCLLGLSSAYSVELENEFSTIDRCDLIAHELVNPFTPYFRDPKYRDKRAILMYGVGFFDNPGLCYSPFSVNWDDILEYPDLQPVILVPMNDKAATFNWLSACAARYESALQRNFSALLPTTSANCQGSDLVSTSKQK